MLACLLVITTSQVSKKVSAAAQSQYHGMLFAAHATLVPYCTAWISPKSILSKSAGCEFDDSPTSFVGGLQATVLCGQSHLGQAPGQVVNMLRASSIDRRSRPQRRRDARGRAPALKRGRAGDDQPHVDGCECCDERSEAPSVQRSRPLRALLDLRTNDQISVPSACEDSAAELGCTPGK